MKRLHRIANKRFTVASELRILGGLSMKNGNYNKEH